ncbi:MAG: putative Ig domain-containing protein, partial [Actinobacteria bacterium]|nr:putative Ig domain-containing protein [Actinomycetota bacterium]
YNTSGQASPPDGTFTQVSAGEYHTCGVRSSDASVACWGYDLFGQSTPPAGTFTQVSAGAYHTCGLRSDASVACWGFNSYGQSTPPAGTFTQVSAGASHTCGLRTDATVACWGDNSNGRAKPPAGTFTQVSAGGYHTCGVRSDATVACWGDNDAGQSTPPAGAFTQVSAGVGLARHTCGVRSDASVACWGYNSDSQATPSITSPAPPAATAGIQYGHQLTTTYESPGPTFTVTAGTLPPGLTLSPAGLISGTPSLPGSFGPITVSATNGLAPVASQTFTIAVVAGRYTPLTPARILDSRNGTGGGFRLGPGQSFDLQVSGQGGVPVTGAEAAVMNVAVTNTSTQSYLTAYPTGEARPLAANLNWVGGLTVSNRAMVKLGAGGKVSLYNNSGSTDVIVDVNGWYSDASA